MLRDGAHWYFSSDYYFFITIIVIINTLVCSINSLLHFFILLQWLMKQKSRTFT